MLCRVSALWHVSMLPFICCACWAVLVTLHVLCLNPYSKHTRQQNALHSTQALLSAVHCNAAEAALWHVSMLPFICSACCNVWVTLYVLCLNPCSKHNMRQHHALHSTHALLSAVYCGAGDTLLCDLCIHASVQMLCMLWFLTHTACAKAELCLNVCSKHIRQQTSIALSCALQCWRCPALWIQELAMLNILLVLTLLYISWSAMLGPPWSAIKLNSMHCLWAQYSVHTLGESPKCV